MSSEHAEPVIPPEEPALSDLEQRLEGLTRELLELRSLLYPRAEPRPRADYDALGVEIAGTRYAIPVEAVEEVLELVWPAVLPGSPSWILGSIHYSGEQVPVVDVQQRLLGEPTVWESATKLVIATRGSLRALVVDAVDDLVRVHVDHITRPPDDIPQSPFLLGSIRPRAGDVVHLLSLERISREHAIPR